MGKNKFLTFRIPNVWHEKGYRLARAYMGMLTANESAEDLGMHSPPIFEVILPMTDSAKKLIEIQTQYTKIARMKCSVFGSDFCRDDIVSMIPLIEGGDALLKSYKILADYSKMFRKKFRRDLKYIRPFIARSDPALNSGFVTAYIAAKGAISEYYRFEDDTGIKVYPIVGVGSTEFRGGLTPYNIDAFAKEYAGIRTVTIQSAFRFDYPLKDVQKAIKQLKRKLPKGKPQMFGKEEIAEIHSLEQIFSASYRHAIEKLEKTINHVAQFVPNHRERILHTGLFGYSRAIKGSKARLPRAITFAAVFYSLGIPPELIGSGRGLIEAERKGKLETLEKFYPQIKQDLVEVGHFLNKENLKFLSHKDGNWQLIAKDIEAIENYVGKELGPKTTDHYLHRNHTSNILHLLRAKRNISRDIVRAGLVRRCLG